MKPKTKTKQTDPAPAPAPHEGQIEAAPVELAELAELPVLAVPRFGRDQPVRRSRRDGKTDVGTVGARYERGRGPLGDAAFWALPAFAGQDTAYGVSYGAAFRRPSCPGAFDDRRKIAALVTVPARSLCAL